MFRPSSNRTMVKRKGLRGGFKGGPKGFKGPRGVKGPRGPMRFKGPFRAHPRFLLAKDAKIDYKNIPLLQKYLNDRGKIVPRRLSGISSRQQRRLTEAIKQARFLALLPTGGVR